MVVKGQGIYAYVTLMSGKEPSEALRKELVAWVRKNMGPIASPDLIQFAPGLPKTRSGKIMRRILRKIAEDKPGSLGDTSTLADPAVARTMFARGMAVVRRSTVQCACRIASASAVKGTKTTGWKPNSPNSSSRSTKAAHSENRPTSPAPMSMRIGAAVSARVTASSTGLNRASSLPGSARAALGSEAMVMTSWPSAADNRF